jgi:hypothetical protein
VDDLGGMRRAQGRRDLARDLDRDRRLQRAVREPVGQRLALEQLHRDERAAIGLGAGVRDLTALEHGDDAEVIDLCGRARLLEEALEQLGIRRVLRQQELQRAVAIELRVTRHEHHAESPWPSCCFSSVPIRMRFDRHGS